MTYLSLLRSNLDRLWAGFSAATGIAPTMVSIIVAEDRAFFGRVAKKDFRVGTYDRIAARFSALWPADAPWPEGIVRPDPIEVDQKSIELYREKLGIHPEWPAGEKWPDDIPQPADRITIPAVTQQEA